MRKEINYGTAVFAFFSLTNDIVSYRSVCKLLKFIKSSKEDAKLKKFQTLRAFKSRININSVSGKNLHEFEIICPVKLGEGGGGEGVMRTGLIQKDALYSAVLRI